MTYDDLVTAATLGLSRRPLPVAALRGPEALSAPQTQGVIAHDDPADALLDAAALHVAARRAGMVLPRGRAGSPRQWRLTWHRSCPPWPRGCCGRPPVMLSC